MAPCKTTESFGFCLTTIVYCVNRMFYRHLAGYFTIAQKMIFAENWAWQHIFFVSLSLSLFVSHTHAHADSIKTGHDATKCCFDCSLKEIHAKMNELAGLLNQKQSENERVVRKKGWKMVIDRKTDIKMPSETIYGAKMGGTLEREINALAIGLLHGHFY